MPADAALFLSVLLAGIAVGGALAVRLDGDEAVASYLVSNLVIGLSAAAVRLPRRPSQAQEPDRLAVPWAGYRALLSAAMAPLVMAGHDAGWPEPALRAA